MRRVAGRDPVELGVAPAFIGLLGSDGTDPLGEEAEAAPLQAEALPAILGGLRARGLRAVTVSALLESSAVPGPAPGPAPAPPEHRRKCRILRVETPLLRGDDMTAVQRALWGRGLDPGPVDGIFGPRTAAAVRRFQAGQGFAVTGVVAEAEYRGLGVACRA